MSTEATTAAPPASEQPHGVPGLPQDAPADVVAASQGETGEVRSEKSALDWLLGATTRLEHDIPVKYETPDGMVELTFRIQQMDGTRLDALEEEHRNGDGPFAKLDTLSYNAAVVAEATMYVADEHRKATIKEIVGEHPAGAVGGLRTRFKYQPGILAGIEREVRTLAAYSNDRVGSAQRALVAAVGNSSS